MRTLTLDDYQNLLRGPPEPTHEQIEEFARFVATAHSWYKHLPTWPPGVPMRFFLDPCAGMERVASWGPLEGRSPLLAHGVVDFAVKLPREQRVQGRRGKHLLRRVAARWLPADVLQKPKQGFGIPLGQWFSGPLRGLAADVIGSRRFKERGLLQPRAAERYLKGHLAGEADYGEILWLILSLELWATRFLDEKAA